MPLGSEWRHIQSLRPNLRGPQHGTLIFDGWSSVAPGDPINARSSIGYLLFCHYWRHGPNKFRIVLSQDVSRQTSGRSMHTSAEPTTPVQGDENLVVVQDQCWLYSFIIKHQAVCSLEGILLSNVDDPKLIDNRRLKY